MGNKNDVLKIENGVVKKCLDKSVTSVVIPDVVTKINKFAFYGCDSLVSVVLSEGVSYIGVHAFWDCKSLKSISLPSTLERIGRDAFEGCKAVESVTSASPLFQFDEKTSKLYDVRGKSKKVVLVAMASKESKKKEKIEQVQLASAAAVLDSILSEHHVENVQVRKEAKDCFVSIPLSDGGIELCLQNTKVKKWMQTLPLFLDKVIDNASEKELREYAAANGLPDASKKHMKIRECVVKKRDVNPVYLVFPDGVKAIANNAFWSCSSLVSVVLPTSVSYIGVYAFWGCKSLKSVVIPNHIKICYGAFYGCVSLESVVFEGTVAQWKAVEKGEDWNEGVPATVVKCTDGELRIEN